MTKDRRPGKVIKMLSVQELLGVSGEESSMEIELRLIHPFKDHPFKVLDDQRMQDLAESIRINGILSPVLLRPAANGTYEMISGHRRMHAAELAGLQTIPAIIRELTDEEATIVMVDSNIQREELLPSEKAYAYKMKHEAVKRQGRRTDLTLDQNGPKLASDIVSDETGESPTQVKRYIRLTHLIPELLDFVDQKRLLFTVAVEASYMKKGIQSWLYEYIKENGPINMKQISLLRNRLQEGPITQRILIDTLKSGLIGKASSPGITFSPRKLRQYFPPEYTPDQMKSVIEALLEKWKTNTE